MKNFLKILSLSLSFYFLLGVSKCGGPELERSGTPPIDFSLEEQRKQSSQFFPAPKIKQLLRNGVVIWSEGSPAPKIYSGETLEIVGSGLGAGTNIDYSKILVGRARVIESDMRMYTGHVDISKPNYFEENKVFDKWDKEILSWSNSKIAFKVPETTNRGPLVVSVQKRTASNKSLSTPNTLHSVWDPNTERLHGNYPHKSDVVSKLSEPKLSNAVDVTVVNKNFSAMSGEGEKIFWSYDFNMGAVHNARKQDWTEVMHGKATDPISGRKADPEELFGAIPITKTLIVPKVAREKIVFDPYPIPNPLTSVTTGKQLYSGETNPTGYVGYVYASSLSTTTGQKGDWIGFSCVSCHGQEISFPDKNGKIQTKVFAGLPNPNWTMKWAALSEFEGVKGEEAGVSGKVDKTQLIFSLPGGSGEHSLVRSSKDTFTNYRNDTLFSPIAIPNVTTHTPLRRSLSHTEFYAGFEGSYIHSEEPDGAIGSMYASSLRALTAYMTTLNKDDHLLHQLAIYRWLKEKNLLGDVGNVSEKDFIYSEKKNYPLLASRLARGEALYKKHCIECHSTNFGTGSDENLIPISEVGTYFSPTIFHKETQSIRTAMMTHLYWVQRRGLLHDTHVKSLEDLVNPERCDTNSSLYKKYYTINSSTFKIPVGTEEQAKATQNQLYFTRVSWDPNHFYWDYQKMLKEFGPKELGSAKPIAMVKTPHPWCLKDKNDIDDLVSFLLTL